MLVLVVMGSVCAKGWACFFRSQVLKRFYRVQIASNTSSIHPPDDVPSGKRSISVLFVFPS